MLTALIADDEEALRAQLLQALHTAWPELHKIHECANGVDAWDAYLEHDPQVCFLDVRMPGMTGIEVAQRIRSRSHVVFVAAPGDHALAAFDAGAVDYVLKPVDAERLARACEPVRVRLAGPNGSPADLNAMLNQLVGQVRRQAPLAVIQVGLGKEVQQVRIEDVVYFESDSRYTRVVSEGGEALMRTPLKELLAQLDTNRFWQVHRSVIVSRAHIVSASRVDETTMLLSLRGRAEKLPVAPHFQGLFCAP